MTVPKGATVVHPFDSGYVEEVDSQIGILSDKYRTDKIKVDKIEIKDDAPLKRCQCYHDSFLYKEGQTSTHSLDPHPADDRWAGLQFFLDKAKAENN